MGSRSCMIKALCLSSLWFSQLCHSPCGCFFSQVGFSNRHKLALSSKCCTMLTCSSPVRGRKGRKGKRMRESKSKKTVLLTIESCSSLWSYWVASTHVPTPRPIPVLREMLCSMGWSQDFWPSLVKSMWLSWWPKPRACKTLPCRPNPASHLLIVA